MQKVKDPTLFSQDPSGGLKWVQLKDHQLLDGERHLKLPFLVYKESASYARFRQRTSGFNLTASDFQHVNVLKI